MLRKLIICLVVATAAALLAPAAVLATGPSAGDQQYVDPLAGSHSSTSSQSGQSSPSSGAPAPSSSASPSATSSSSSSTSSTSSNSNTTGTATGSTSSTSGAASGNTLPVTGYDAPLAALVGVSLVAFGTCLRRATRKA